MKPYQERNYLLHPSSIMMALILIGITALFGALTFAYLYARIDRQMVPIRLPGIFVINTIILAASSVFIQFCKKYFDRQNERLILRYGILAIVSTVTFLILQIIGWDQLLESNILPKSSGAYGYLYAISILHFLHVVAGIPFLLRILLPLYSSGKAGNSTLYFLTGDNQRKLKHTVWYWHFIDVMWVYLVIFFVVNGYL